MLLVPQENPDKMKMASREGCEYQEAGTFGTVLESVTTLSPDVQISIFDVNLPLKNTIQKLSYFFIVLYLDVNQ